MKNLEQIKERITFLESQIIWYKRCIVEIETEVSEKIEKYKSNPAYIAEWMPTWMKPVGDYQHKIDSYVHSVDALKWTIE